MNLSIVSDLVLRYSNFLAEYIRSLQVVQWECYHESVTIKAKNFTNSEIADLLRNVAAALEIKGASRFRIVAYEKAADSIEHSSIDAKDLWDDHKLGELPGIGGSIGGHLDELFGTGKSKHFEETLGGLPPGMFPLLKVPGVGPKNAYKLSLALGLTHEHSAISKLEKAAKQGEIRKIETFGADSEARIIAGIEELKNRGTRTLMHLADKQAEEILIYLRKHPAVKDAHPLGSLRRRVATVGDIDLSAATDQPKEVLEHFANYPGAKRVVEKGTVSATIMLGDSSHVDLLVQGVESYGSLLQHFTGSKNHNIHLREIAMKKGKSLSEKGVKDMKTEKMATFKTETELYKFFGMAFIPPELREDTGEIEAALRPAQGKLPGLPDLIELADIKGEFHVHSDFEIEPSHDLGLSSMEVMLRKAGELGYEYLAFSEHNPSVAKHTKKQVVDLLKKKRDVIDKLNSSGKIKVVALNSLEIDIQPDGKLAIPDEGFEYLDMAIVSLHSSFLQNRNDMTTRVLRALEHPKVQIFGHPTGRLLNKREGVELDWEQIFDFCLKNDKWLEIDGWPDRLDLPENLVREAAKLGVKLTIDSDAHQVDHMEMLRYGVSVARRGWVEKNNVVNTVGWKELSKLLKLG